MGLFVVDVLEDVKIKLNLPIFMEIIILSSHLESEKTKSLEIKVVLYTEK
jgi:hypothetical protein